MQYDKSKKYIHYCWFGKKPLPKLAKKCIDSWKKYLPEYEIICWNEENTNVSECPFVKEAYQKGKFAFVADYTRTKAIYEYGGIYLDTDMEIKKDISNILENETFLGEEDDGVINVAVWGAKKPKSKLAKEMLDFYQSQKHFNSSNIYSITIPTIATNILLKYGYKKDAKKVQKLNNGVTIYPRDYFYPLSYNYHNNRFSNNTCMIHYFDASWTSKNEQKDINLIRKIGPNNANRVFALKHKTKLLVNFYGKVVKRTVSLPFYPIRKVYKKHSKAEKSFLQKQSNDISLIKKPYFAIAREDWLGVRSATESVFDNVITIPEIQGHNPINLTNAIIKNHSIKTVFFAAFDFGWENIATAIKKERPEIKVKVIWHGSNAMHIEAVDWDRFKKIFELLNNGTVEQIVFVKKSMYELYKRHGYNVEFLPNNYSCNKYIHKKTNDRTRIGIYSSGARWVKNFYNQLAGASLIENAEIDVIPIPKETLDFAKILRINIEGETNSIKRAEMLKRIEQDDIVIYTSFTECAPIMPLECLESEVLCITGDNHHYWTDTPLEKYLIEPKIDNPVAIADRIKLCLENRDKIIQLYKEWKKEYNSYCEKKIKEFFKNAS